MKSKKLSKQEILLLGSMYITQYVALSFFSVAIVAIWREHGMSLEMLGLFSLVNMVWVVKFFWAPQVDKYIIKQGDTYKRFLLIIQFLLVISVVIVSFFDVLQDKAIIIAALVVIGILSATQDIAAEGLAYKILAVDERGFGGSLKTIGGIVGYIIGGGISLNIYESYGWQVTILMLAVITAVTFIQLFVYSEHNKHAHLETEQIDWKHFFGFWKTKGRKKWLLFIVVFPLGMGMAHGIMTPLMVDSGWSMTKIGNIMGIGGSLLGIISALIVGWLLKYYSRKSVLVGILLVEGVGYLGLLLIQPNSANLIIDIIAVSMVMVTYGASMPIISALMMDHIRKSAASEYALQFSVFTLAHIVAKSVGTALAGVFGYAIIIIASSLSALLVALFVKKYFTEGIEG